MTALQFQRCLVWHVCLLVVGSVTVSAQTVQAIDVAAERLRIAQERQRHEATFVQAQADCYRRFAVSDCLQEARQSHRGALDDLRRQELVLNDEDRKRAGAAALQRIEDKLSAPDRAVKAP